MKVLSLLALIGLLSITGCEKEEKTELKVEKTETYVFEGKEYNVKSIQQGNDLIRIENETTKMLDAAMENPTSSTFVDLGTSKIYLFSTSDEADQFVKKLRKTNSSQKNLKSENAVSLVEYFLNANMDTTSNVYYPSLCYIFLSNYVNGDYDNLNLSNYSCDDQVSSLIIHASPDYDVYVTLCENPGGINSSGHRLYFVVPKGPLSNSAWIYNLSDYVMIRKLGVIRKTWNDQVSSVYYGLN